MAGDDLAPAYAHCQTLVREQDLDRFYATLLVRAEARRHVFALYAFSSEIARVRDAVSSPMPGEVRLQWWRDLLGGEARGEVAAHPVASALNDTVERFHLPRAGFLALIDARTFDLYDDPMPSMGDLEGYLGETSSALMRLVSLVLAGGDDPGSPDLPGYAGLAYGLTGLMRALPWHARRGQLYLPRDILERYGVTRDDVVFGRGGPGLLSALADLRGIARHHLAQAARVAAGAPRTVRLACLPAALASRDLQLMERRDYDPFRTIVDQPAWRKILTLWRAARSARR